MNTELNRRHFLQQAGLYLAATSATCMGCSSAFGYSHFRGCALNASGARAMQTQNNFYESVNNEEINNLFTEYTWHLSVPSGMWPSFAFVGGNNSRNAFATNEDIIDGKSPVGAVLFGVDLINELWSWPTLDKEANKISILAVLAHEWAHIAQFHNNFESRETKNIELMADFMAGWSVAEHEDTIDSLERAGSINTDKKDNSARDTASGALTFLQSIGDTNFHSPDHHGAPRERLMAYIDGVKFRRGHKIYMPSGARYLRALEEGRNRYL